MKGSKLIPLLLVTAGLVMLMTGGLSVFAATTATQGLSFTNPVTSSITLEGNAVNFGQITAGTPALADNAAVVHGVSNASFTVTLTGTDFTGAATLDKDDVLEVSTNNATFNHINDGLAVITNQAAGSADVTMDYRLTIPEATPGVPGAYTATLTYTISNS